MIIKKLELYKFKRFFLSQVDHFILEPKSNIMIMAWGNGKGKSSLLSVLNPLPAELKRDFKEDGYKYIEIMHRGHEYKISSGKLEKNKHSFIYDDVELNPGGTKRVQLELVSEHFNLTPNINQILLGTDRFTQMSPTIRKEWFNKLSTIDYTYPIKVYNNLKSRYRDITGGIKLFQENVVKLTADIITEEELTKLKDQRANLEGLITYILSLYTHDEGIDVDTAILKDLNSVVNELRNNSYITLPSYDLDYYTANLAKLETNINTLKTDIKSIQDKLHILENKNKFDGKSLEELDTIRKDKVSRLLELRKSNKFKIPLYRAYMLSNTFNMLYQNLIAYVSELNDYERPSISLKLIEETINKLTGVDNELKVIDRKIQQVKGELNGLEKYNKVEDMVVCPQCQNQFHVHYDPNKSKLLTTMLQKFEEEFNKYSAIRKKLIDQIELYNKIKTIIDNIKSAFLSRSDLSFIHNYIYENIDYNTSTNNILSIIDTVKHELEYRSNYVVLYKELLNLKNERNKLKAIRNLEQKLHIDNIKVLEDELNLKTQELITSRQGYKLLEDNKNVLVKINTLESRLKNILKHYRKAFDKALLALKNKHLNEVVTELKSLLVSYDQKLLQNSQARSQLDSYNKNIEEYKKKEEVLSTMLKVLSPSDGIIAKSINSFLNIFIQEMNHIINSVWSYEMVLLPCDITEDNDLDYKFKVKVNNDEVIEDVSKLSSSMQEIVDLAYKIVFMKYMRISDTPLILDEFGRTMDATHRDTAYNIIDRIFSTNFDQIFLVSHFESMYGRFVNADIVQLEEA